MRRSDLNSAFREHVRAHLSPTPDERQLISDIYAAIQDVLGAQKCLQIGSYPRFTAVSPVHDLDVLYVIGIWNPDAHDPSVALTMLHQALDRAFKNPTHWRLLPRFSSGQARAD